MDHTSVQSSQNRSSTPPREVLSNLKKVQVVYYLSYRDGLLEQPHLLEVSLSSSRGLCLRDVKTRLASLRGAVMSCSFSWSYKRSYKQGFVWQDLESDNDLVFPMYSGSEYVIKGCKIESSCTSVEQIPASSPNAPQSLREIAHGVSRLAELPAPPAETQSSKATNSLAIDRHDNRIIAGSPSPASCHGCTCADNLTLKHGMIEGLEHLHLAKAMNLHSYDSAESQASTSLRHIHKATEQNKRNAQDIRPSKESSISIFQKEATIIGGEHYAPSEFSVVKRCKEGDSTTPSNSRPLYVGADVATQTGEDEETTNIVVKHKTEKLPCPKSRAQGAFFSRQLSALQSALIELSREEISSPLCSSSSSSTTMSAHSASSSNHVDSSANPLRKLSLNQSTYLAENQNLQGMRILSSSKDQGDEEALLNEEEATASNSDAVGVNFHGCKNPESALHSSKIKPHEMDICSNSGRFLHLVSCGRGLEVIKPSDRYIRRSSSMSGLRADVCEEASSMQHLSLSNATCLDSSPPNANVDSCVATNDDFNKLLCNADSHQLAVPSAHDSSRSFKKLWHLRGWVHSPYKKKRSTKSKSISADSAADEDAYASLDLFQKHVANLNANGAENSSSQCKLIRVGSANYSLNPHQRSSSYGSHPSTSLLNEFVASPSQRPQIRSEGLITSSSTSTKYGYDRWW